MSFDLFFIAAETEDEASRVLREKDLDRAATPLEEVRMHRLVCRLLQISPHAVVKTKAGGFSSGLWIGNGDFPELDVYPSYIFSSFQSPVDGEAAGRIRELLGLFEELGYLGFDPQRGDFVNSANFGRGDEASVPAQGAAKPWWQIW